VGYLVEGQWCHAEQLTPSGVAYQKASSRFVGEVSRAVAELRQSSADESGYIEALRAYFSRFTLFASLACPWVHRVLLARALGPVGEALRCRWISGEFGEEGWRLPLELHPLTGRPPYVHSLYTHTHPQHTGRVTLPLLWDHQEERLVSNDSGELMRALGGSLLAPPDELQELDLEAAWLQSELNIAPYRAGFASTQAHYEQAVLGLFQVLDQLEERLERGEAFLRGAQLSELDLRLLPTLVRFDIAYVTHFKCNLKRLVDYPALSAYLRRLCVIPAVRETIDLDEVKLHYFKSVPKNDHVPLGPPVDFL